MQVRVTPILASWIVTAVAACGACAGEFPFIAYVVEPDSYVRSGPGREHYATGQLPAGFAVEVYRLDGDGWCAIRPPEGSFSLAPTHELRLVDERTAEVTADGVVARVGSSLVGQHRAVQVMLERGEHVALLEQPSPTSPWVRIAPPAGEFRWIAARRLSRTPPVEPLPGRGAAVSWQSNAQAAASVGANLSDNADDVGGNAFAHLSGEAATPSAHLPTAVATGDDIQIIAGSPADVRQAQYQEATADTAAPPLADAATAAPLSTPPRVRFEGLSAAEPLDPRVAEMQLRLSQIVVGVPAAWQFGGLREETAALLAQEQSAELREQLRDLLDRIATFETIQSRYRTLPASPSLVRNATPAPLVTADGRPAATDGNDVLARARADLGALAGVADNGVTPTPGGPTPPATEALYDAVGTLKPVVSRRQNAPQYALIDDHGDVVTFVTASPDVNLQTYVGQRIGVRGSRGFMPEYRRAHVTASRVTSLEQTLVK